MCLRLRSLALEERTLCGPLGPVHVWQSAESHVTQTSGGDACALRQAVSKGRWLKLCAIVFLLVFLAQL
eukprot:m.78643 g.78643  ORF g.78643 m.78643 type:complete len:69 (-) comp12540_c0_seq2:122-328(-)